MLLNGVSAYFSSAAFPRPPLAHGAAHSGAKDNNCDHAPSRALLSQECTPMTSKECTLTAKVHSCMYYSG